MFDIQPVSGHIGARITGLDLREAPSPTIGGALRAALQSHQVLFLPGQGLDLAQQKRITALFGPLYDLPYVVPLEGEPQVVAVLKKAEERNVGVFGGDWHSDFSFLENPPSGSVLSAVTLPPWGGDTLWSSMVAAYEALPDDLKKLLEGRGAIHVGKPYGVKHAPPRESRSSGSIQMTRDDPEADRERLHPAVLTLPESGQRALFVNPIYTTRLEGMSEAESEPLLDQLYRHCIRPEFGCRHRWQTGDLVIWDNRATLHYAVNDYDGHDRLLYRTTFGGPPPQ